MLIIAHRGAWLKTAFEKDKTRQNTYEAFQDAEDLDLEAVETDLRRCPADGLLKLSHDPIDSNSHEKLAKLEEFLPFGKWMALHIEIKEKGLVREILEMAEHLRHKHAIVYSSFKWIELFKIRLRESRARIGLLWNQNKVKLPPWLVACIGKLLGAESIHLNFQGLNKGVVRYFRKKRFLVYAYTVNSQEEMVMAMNLDLDGIFTDFPERAYDLFSNIVIQ